MDKGRLRMAALLLLSAILVGVVAGNIDIAPPPTVDSPYVSAVRFSANPLLTSKSNETIGDNLNGPSVIRAPAWLKQPLGRYYLYFAHHHGDFIRLAYADRLDGPWKIYEPGTLKLSEASACYDHIASPDVEVDDARQEIRMYFHCPSGARKKMVQSTFLATSKDGLHFSAGDKLLGPSYFRVLEWGGYVYAFSRDGSLFRASEHAGPFEAGPSLFKHSRHHLVRHVAVDLRGDTLWVYYSRIGDRPERIMVSRIKLDPDWKKWSATYPEDVLKPDMAYEGSNLPMVTSKPGEVREPAPALQDPAIFRDGNKTYLFYVASGERAIAAAELFVRDPDASASTLDH